MSRYIFLLISFFILSEAHCQDWHWKCDRTPLGEDLNCVKVPGKDPETTILGPVPYNDPKVIQRQKEKEALAALTKEIELLRYRQPKYELYSDQEIIRDMLSGKIK